MMRVGTILLLLVATAALAAPQTQPATRSVEPPAATPKEALHSLNLAQRDGDADAMRSLFVAADARGQALVAEMADYASALFALHQAAEQAYGAEGANLLTGDLRAESAQGLRAIDKAQVTTDGDRAVVKYGGATDAPIRLVRIDGRWRIPVGQLLDGADATAEERGTRELQAQAQIARRMADEISAGKFKEGVGKAKEAWRSRLLEGPSAAKKPESRSSTQPASAPAPHAP